MQAHRLELSDEDSDDETHEAHISDDGTEMEEDEAETNASPAVDLDKAKEVSPRRLKQAMGAVHALPLPVTGLCIALAAGGDAVTEEHAASTRAARSSCCTKDKALHQTLGAEVQD